MPDSPFSDGSEACYPGVDAVDVALGGTIILGDTFLRSAYVVYDLENQIIGHAQAKYNVSESESNVVPIPSGRGVPGMSSTATVAVATAAATSLAEPVGRPTGAVASGTSIVTGTPTFDLGLGISAKATDGLGSQAPSVHSGARETLGGRLGVVASLAGVVTGGVML